MATTTGRGHGRRRALVVLLSTMLLLAAVPGSVRAAAFALGINAQDGSSWSWPGMAQTFATMGPIDSASLVMHRGATDSGTFRVEIRTAPGGVPSGSQAPSSGVVLASASVSVAGISTDGTSPSTVNVEFDAPAIAPAGVSDLAIVVIRGSTAPGLKWHASTPDGVDQYAEGEGFLCVLGACWQGYTPAGDVDFVATIYGSSALENSIPRAAIVAPKGPTRATSFTWTTLFDKPVSGLTAADFTKTGTADGCSLGAPATGDGGVTWTMAVTGCTAGTLKLTLKANTVASTGDPSPVSGPFAAVGSAATLRIDRTRPVGTTPNATPYTGAPLSGSSIPVKLAWALASDAGGAGVWKYEIARSTNGGTSWTLLGEGQPNQAAVTQPATGSVIYRVRPVDWASNKGAWVKGPTLLPRIVQQSNANITYSTGWSTFTDPRFSGGSAKGSSRSGASAKYTFSGRAIGVVMSTDSTLGIVKVYLDGTLVKTVDLSLKGTSDKTIVYAKRFGSYGTHTIRVVSASTARPQIFLDAFVRL